MGRSLRLLQQRTASVLVVMLLAASSARADAPALSPEQERLVEAGLDARDNQHDADALALFEQAESIRHDARILAQIAFAEQALGRWVHGYEHLLRALEERGHPWIEAHRALLTRELDTLASHVGRVTVVANVPDAALFVQGERVGTLPLAAPLAVLPGRVVIEARAEGYLSAMQTVDVEPAVLSRVELKLVPRARADEVSSADRAAGGDPSKQRNPRWFYGVGAGAAAAAASLIPWFMAEAKVDDAAACTRAESCSDARFEREVASVHRLDRATNAVLFTGLGVAVVSATLYFVLPRERRHPSVTALERAPAVRGRF